MNGRHHVNLYVACDHLITDVYRLDPFPRQATLGHESVEHHNTDQFRLAQLCQLHSITEMVAMGMGHQNMTRMKASQVFLFRRRCRVLGQERIDQ
jgi:hypothetical protein